MLDLDSADVSEIPHSAGIVCAQEPFFHEASLILLANILVGGQLIEVTTELSITCRAVDQIYSCLVGRRAKVIAMGRSSGLRARCCVLPSDVSEKLSNRASSSYSGALVENRACPCTVLAACERKLPYSWRGRVHVRPLVYTSVLTKSDSVLRLLGLNFRNLQAEGRGPQEGRSQKS